VEVSVLGSALRGVVWGAYSIVGVVTIRKHTHSHTHAWIPDVCTNPRRRSFEHCLHERQQTLVCVK
jgi:hypothetical protein